MSYGYDNYRQLIQERVSREYGHIMSQKFSLFDCQHKQNLSCWASLFGQGRSCDKVVVVISGTHGLEGPLGAEFQLTLLEKIKHAPRAYLPVGVNLLVVFALNPWGFANGQRTDQDNIDINRNAIIAGRKNPFNPEYDLLAEFITPKEWDDRSFERLWEHGRNMGMKRFQRALSQGQYKHPTGLFYGGKKETWSINVLHKICRNVLAPAKKVGVIDVHTGLGKYAIGELISPLREESVLTELTRSVLGDTVHFPNMDSDLSSPVSGDILNAVMTALPQAQVLPAAVEVGVLPIKQLLEVMARANWARHNPDKVDPKFKARINQDLRAAFYNPDDINWMMGAMGSCLGAYSKMLNWLAC